MHSLEQFRGPLLALSVISLAYGFWSVYREPSQCEDCTTCSPERSTQRRVQIGVMWGVAVFVFGVTMAGLLSGSAHVH
jgi:hypothetical protein